MIVSLWVLVVLVATITADVKENSSPFLPALPGETPACAKKGKSFCEYVDGYPEHVIGYLLERGAFDTNTLFMSESNVKPPQFNKTEKTVELKPRHRYVPYNYAPTYIPKPVNELLSHFTRVPFSKQIYRDYLDYYKSQQDKHYYLTHSGPSTVGPPHYLPAQPGPGREPIFFSDLDKVRFPSHQAGPEVEVKPHSEDTVSPTPYKYKIIKDTEHHHKTSSEPHVRPDSRPPAQPDEPAEESPQSRQLPDRELSTPDKSYLPPPPSHPHHPPHHSPNHPLNPPPHHPSHAPHHPSHAPHHPSHAPRHPSHAPHHPHHLSPPSPSVSPPSKSYLPPPSPETPPAEPQTGYLPPHKSYLPPSPTHSLPPQLQHNPTVANINEVHSLPSLEDIRQPKVSRVPNPSLVFPQINEVHAPPQELHRSFIGPQLPPNRPPSPPPQPHLEPVPKFSIAGHFQENRIDFSNKKKLQEALKNFNAKPNIDREAAGQKPQLDIDLISSDLDNNQLEQLKITTESVSLLNTQRTNTTTTESDITPTTSPTTTARSTSSFTTTTIPTTSTTFSTTSEVPRLRIDEFLPNVDEEQPIVLSAGNHNDGFVFGPTQPSLVFSSPLPESDSDQVNDIILGDIEILITGRGDKTVRPRSFTPAAVPSLSSTPAPVPIFSLGKVEVGQQLGDEINFQPQPYKEENYRVTDFSQQTTAGGHTYRLTTPTSTVFVQRSFGQQAPVSTRTLTLKRQINETSPTSDNTTETVLDSLQGAVDVLTRSSLGYMNQNEIDQNNLELENDIETIQREIETLQKDIEILNNAEITFDLTDEENKDDIFTLKQNLDDLVQGFDDAPVDVAENHKDIKSPQFQHFPVVNVENIYDKNAIESLLEDFTDKNSVVPEVIESDQFDDILMSNYLVSSHHTNQPTPVVQESSGQHGVQDSVPVHKKTVDIIHGKPIDKVAGPIENFPRAEKLVSIPDSVSSFITSVKSFISYDGADRPSSRFTPSTTEKLGLRDVALKSHPVVESDQQYVQYVPPPSLTSHASTLTSHASSRPSPAQQEDEVSLEEQGEQTDIQKFWPETKLNVTYQENWIGHEESPIEVERRRRQLSLGPSRPRIESNLAQSGAITHSTLEQQHRERQRRQAETEQSEEQLRERRQTTDPDQLCPTLASFVMPRAAVNSQGDWMFIVNMNDQPEFQQLVRSEVCISDNCRGLCSVPPGLQTKCSQQFVQKKLIALHPNGDRLVEDMFWFPSCCVCQVTQN